MLGEGEREGRRRIARQAHARLLEEGDADPGPDREGFAVEVRAESELGGIADGRAVLSRLGRGLSGCERAN
eukprot:5417110-Pyramimonas_sp.AAC.1